MRGRKLREGIGLAALNVFFVALCFVTLIPILYALSVSLNGQNALLSSDFSFIPEDFTLENYLAVFTGEDILTWFGNSVILAVSTVAVSLAAAVPAAYCFSRRSFPGRRLVLRWLVLLNSFPAILSMFAVYRLLRPMGLVNHRLGLIIVYTGTMAVFSLWNMKGYFDTVPLEIEEAARMDGATDLQVVTRHRTAAGKAQRRRYGAHGAHLRLERIYLRHDLHDRRAELHPRRRALRPAGHGDQRLLAGICRGVHSCVAAGARDLLPLPEAHDLRPHRGRRERIA